MKIAPPGWQPDAGTQPEDLIREARRRQRRRRVLVGVAIAAVLAGVTAIATGLGGQPPGRTAARSHPSSQAASGQAVRALAPIPRSIGTTLLMWPVGYPAFGPSGGPPAYVDDLSTGRLTQGRELAIAAGDFQPLLVQVGRWFVYVGNEATAIRDDLTGRARVLGPTPFFAPAAAPGRVWLFQFHNGLQGPIRAWTVALSGGPPSQPVTLPASAYLPVIRGTDAGLLLQASQGLALWNPGSAPRTLPYSPSIADGFDATPRLVAYGTGCRWQVTAPGAAQDPNTGYETCTMLRVLDVMTGKLISFPAPPGTAGWVPSGFGLVSAISHDDQMIAAYAAMRPQGTGQARLYVIRIASLTGRAMPVPSSAAYLFARTAWSANDTWLLYQGPGGRLWAYQVTSDRTGASSTPCCQYTVMVSVPSRSG